MDQQNINIYPFDVAGHMEIPGWGQLPGNYIEDAITWARAFTFGPAQSPALALDLYGKQLEEMVARKTWRSPKAAEMLALLRRLVLAEQDQALN
jgi:hypothetical protein